MEDLKQELLQRGLVGSVGDAWAAGLIDGEGSIICTAYMRKRSSTDEGNFTLSPAMLVSQSSTKVLHLLRAHFGAGYISAPRKPTGISKLVSYQWRIKGFKATEEILRRIVPFLVVKEDRARDLLSALDDIKAIDRSVRTGNAGILKRRNQGTRQVAHVLLPWLEKHQPDSKTRELCMKHATTTIELGRKLTNADVLDIIRKANEGAKYKELAAQFNVSSAYISYLAKHK